MRVRCKLCWQEFDESEVEHHHIIPKSIGGTDKDGRAYLCKKCHTIWHFSLLRYVWSFVPKESRELCKQRIKIIFHAKSRKSARERGLLDEYISWINWKPIQQIESITPKEYKDLEKEKK